MSSADDPTCSCECDGQVAATTPPAPGQASLVRRVGTHGSFFARMIRNAQSERLPDGSRPLLGLNLGAPADATRGLMDAWASALDVLTFYQERISNEAYLRTATERRSVLELARTVGYELGAGVAAETYLQFTVDEAVGAPTSSRIDAGIQVQSVPAQDEKPQTFEADATIVAHRAWNAMTVVSTGTFAWPTGATGELTFDAINLGLRVGDLLVAGSGTLPVDNLVSGYCRLSVTEVRPSSTQTVVAVSRLDGAWPSATSPWLYVFRRSTVPFGANAPPGYVSSVDTDGKPTWSPNGTLKFTGDQTLDLVGVEELAVPGTLALVDVAGTTLTRTLTMITAANKVARTAFGLSATLTRLTLPAGALSTSWKLADTAVWVGSAPLPLATPVLAGPMSTTQLQLAGDYSDLPIGGWLAVSGTVTATGAAAVEIVQVAKVSSGANPTVVELAPALVNGLDPATVRVSANVVPASHGETNPAEILGSGDGTRTNQEFLLRRPPLTWRRGVPAATPALLLQVNGAAWTQVATLYGQDPDARVYTVRLDDDGTVRVRFGDGISGARLPTGTENVIAAYRTGIGTAAEVAAGQLRLLKQRPLGIKSVGNPLPASGAADAESRADARRNAPVTVLTLDRVVSVRDYADYARSYAGVGRAVATVVYKKRTPTVVLSITSSTGEAGSAQLCADVTAALEAVRDPAAMAFRVEPARLVLLRAVLGVYVDDAYDPDAVLADVEAEVAAAFAFDGRDFLQGLGTADLAVAAHRVAGVVAIEVRAFEVVSAADTGSAWRAAVDAGTFADLAHDPFIGPSPAEWTGTVWAGAELLLLHDQEPILATRSRA